MNRRMTPEEVDAASQLMRDIEDHLPEAVERLKDIYRCTGQAYVIGITGAPGSGKSTLVDKVIEVLRKEGKSVGVVAVDPSSPFTGGAILGDRVRMQRHAGDEGVFIRSLASRGSLGGLCRAAQDIIHVMDAMGMDIIIVETVGVGQSEIDIVSLAHTSIVVLVPGMGDEMQAIKAGIVEIGDIFVINKADRNGAERLEAELREVCNKAGRQTDEFRPSIFKTVAKSGKGVVELVTAVLAHKVALAESGRFMERQKAAIKMIFLRTLEDLLLTQISTKIEQQNRWESILADLIERRCDPYTMAEQIIREELFEHTSHGYWDS